MRWDAVKNMDARRAREGRRANGCFYEDSFVKPPLIAALMGGTLWALREGR